MEGGLLCNLSLLRPERARGKQIDRRDSAEHEHTDSCHDEAEGRGGGHTSTFTDMALASISMCAFILAVRAISRLSKR